LANFKSPETSQLVIVIISFFTRGSLTSRSASEMTRATSSLILALLYFGIDDTFLSSVIFTYGIILTQKAEK
jgi:hypothetical protein